MNTHHRDNATSDPFDASVETLSTLRNCALISTIQFFLILRLTVYSVDLIEGLIIDLIAGFPLISRINRTEKKDQDRNSNR